MKREHIWMAAVTAAVMCLFLGVTALASAAYRYWYVVGDTNNTITMSNYQNRIEEEYEVPDHVDPGAEINKVVNVKNTGSVATLVRVSVDKQFGTYKKDGTFAKDENLNPEMIEITYNTSSWKAGADGFFYYKDILKPGTTTKEPLFTSFKLSPWIGEDYEGKDARIVVSMESVQAEGDAVSLWGVTYKYLGITALEGTNADPTWVIYQGRNDGFDIATERTDLFASFKNLLPGCSRTQRIYVENDSDETVEIFLRADKAHQKEMSDEQSRLVNQMLNEYAAIEIMNGEETIYEGPVSGNLSGARQTMKNDISLGMFIPHNIETLKVKLSLSPDMDNKFLELSGKVKWVFMAKGADGEEVSTVHPAQTDDENSVCLFAILVCISIFALFILWKKRSGIHKNDQNRTADI